MTVISMEFRDSFGENLPLFDLDRTRDALAKYVEIRWPTGRRKSVGRAWGLTDDEARSVCSGHTSWQTWDKIVRHPAGGWDVLFPVYGALLNETAEHFIIKKRKAYADHAARLGALVGDWWPLGADRRSDGSDADRAGDYGRRVDPDRPTEGARRRADQGGRS